MVNDGNGRNTGYGYNTFHDRTRIRTGPHLNPHGQLGTSWAPHGPLYVYTMDQFTGTPGPCTGNATPVMASTMSGTVLLPYTIMTV